MFYAIIFPMNDKKTSLTNFRDMGGLETPLGLIKDGMLFRTAIISPKTKADKAYIESLSLDCVIDLRTRQETIEKPNRLPNGVEYINVSVFDNETSNILAPTRRILRKMLRASESELTDVRGLIEDSYRDMIYNTSAYSEIFKRMDEGKRIAFHCTAGKDRTGIAAILIELAFGRTPDQCREQYLLSNEYHKADNEKMLSTMKLLHVKPYVRDFSLYASTTHSELFDAAMDAVYQQYQTIEDFLSQVHSITPERTKEWAKFYIQS